jgi:hypothetical protein
MSTIVEDALETYRSNIRLVLLFSIPFVIAFLIPLIAPLPTYISGGGIFLRSASIFLNLNVLSLAVIVVSVFISLLFLSFAYVAISLIVKAKRTLSRTAAGVARELEKYTGRVFVVLLLYAFVLTLVDVLSYFVGLQGIATPVVGFFLFALVFYAPASIVINNSGVLASMKQSALLVAKRPQYFLLWIALLVLVVSILDFLLIHITGTPVSSYLMLVLNSLFVVPYFVILQAEAYMRRFSILGR